MSDPTPPPLENDPLGDRVRATFAAEHSDQEKRHQHRSPAAPTKRSVPWVPFAAAAAMIAVAALAFIGLTRGTTDQTVELEIAAQPTSTPLPANPTSVEQADPIDPPVVESTPDTAPVTPPVPTAANECGGSPIMFVPHFVWNVAVDDPDGGLVAHSAPGVDAPVTRILGHNAWVVTTGGCVETDNGSEWYEIEIPEVGKDWVNARYLTPAEPVCFVGGSIGADTRDGVRDPGVWHNVAPADTLVGLAVQYDVTVDAILEANPSIDQASLQVGFRLRIPDRAAIAAQFSGPLDGWGVYDDNTIAFTATQGPSTRTYRWHSIDDFSADCSDSALPRSPLCLTGTVALRSSGGGDDTRALTGPTTVWRTGTTDGLWLEVELFDSTGELVAGFVDPAANDSIPGHCVRTGADSLAAQPCTRVLQPADADPSWIVSQPGSSADHVHDLRTESNADCTRLVVEFGSNANEDSDATADILPQMSIASDADSVIITPLAPLWEGAFGDVDRVDYPGGIGLLVVSTGFEFSAQFRHQAMEPHVRFMSDPARVVIDLFPTPDTESHGPSGDRFILREPLQSDLTGPGIPVEDEIYVFGYGRPFEAQGEYRIWSVPPDVDPSIFLEDPPDPLVRNPLRTTSWADGWGEFLVRLPNLEPGTYIAVFGELPPTDEIGFYGSGQLFRVAAPDDPPTSDYPPAVLLPDVQLPPEPFG